MIEKQALKNIYSSLKPIVSIHIMAGSEQEEEKEDKDELKKKALKRLMTGFKKDSK